MRKSLVVLGAVVVAFFVHGLLHLEAATIALLGAVALVLYAKSGVEDGATDLRGAQTSAEGWSGPYTDGSTEGPGG